MQQLTWYNYVHTHTLKIDMGLSKRQTREKCYMSGDICFQRAVRAPLTSFPVTPLVASTLVVSVYHRTGSVMARRTAAMMQMKLSVVRINQRSLNWLQINHARH